ncbi:hypothetical protein [Halodesulfurarchaeum sp.]|uniref:hypothetical protein n=1 Tax=Halodesulfurarchaeum sp. TaxID=1980530 RepID=UPI002FC36520
MTATLAEPAVLAAAKETLYPGQNTASEQYTVTETQFTQRTWGGWEIPAEIRERLSPFNTIHLAGGEPDLLGIGMPATEVLNENAATNPVTVIEAKGHNSDPSEANVARGINQAHGHLAEVNLGFVAAPIESVNDRERALARELNVGIIGVESPQKATIVEPARVTGAGDFSTTVDAIRFQASTHRLTEGSFPVNHPKNYLGYVLSLAASGDTEKLYSKYVINAVRQGRHGAILLNLVDDTPRGEDLTYLGEEVARFAREQHGSLEKALEQFNSWTGRSTRFTELAPRWAQIARGVAIRYRPTQLVVDALEKLHQGGIKTASIAQVAKTAADINPPLTVEVFFSRNRREEVLTPGGEIDESMLDDPAVYKSGVHFQYKAQLYHVGLITSGGTDDKLGVLSDEWKLEQPVYSR